MQKINSNKKAQVSSNLLLLIAGILIAVVITIAFLRVISGFLSSNEDTVKKFQSFTTKIDEVSKTKETFSTETELIHLNYGESILFFDKNSNVLIKLSGVDLNSNDIKELVSLNFNDFIISDKNIIFRKIASKSFSPDLLQTKIYFNKILFKKPDSCGDNACAVLCSKFTVTKLNKTDLINIIGLDFNNINTDNYYLAECKSNQVKTYQGVENFYIKPSLHTYFEKTTPIKDILENNDPKLLNTYLFGASLQSPRQYFALHENDKLVADDDGDKEKFIDGTDYYLNNDVPGATFLYFITNPFSDKKLATAFNKNQYVSFTKAGNDVVLCYEQPCLTQKEIKYYEYQRKLYDCVDNNNCDELLNSINNEEQVIMQQDSIFKIGTLESKSYFSINNTQFNFDKNFKIIIQLDENNQNDVNELVLKSKIFVPRVKPILVYVSNDGSDYKLIKIESQDSSDKLEKKLLFSFSKLSN